VVDVLNCIGVNIVILNWQRLLWEGGQEVMKRSGRDEPIWVVIHMCMETTLGFCLYSYFYLKLAKMLLFLLSLQQNQRIRGQNRFCPEVGGWEVAQIMYMHVSKYKKDKIK
jgi:hypothetical protein